MSTELLPAQKKTARAVCSDTDRIKGRLSVHTIRSVLLVIYLFGNIIFKESVWFLKYGMKFGRSVFSSLTGFFRRNGQMTHH